MEYKEHVRTVTPRRTHKHLATKPKTRSLTRPSSPFPTLIEHPEERTSRRFDSFTIRHNWIVSLTGGNRCKNRVTRSSSRPIILLVCVEPSNPPFTP